MNEKSIYRLINLVLFGLFCAAIIWVMNMDISTSRRVVALFLLCGGYSFAMMSNYEDYDTKTGKENKP